jgi:ABC-type transporter MlaC component
MVLAGQSVTWANPQVQKPIKRLIKAIQYQKDAIALKSFNGHLQGQSLIGPEWTQKSDKEQDAFIHRLHQFFTLMAFPKLRADLKHLETIIYKKPIIKGKEARIEAVIVVLHALKKQEIPVAFDLYKTKKKWQIVEFKIGEASPFLAQLKTTQIQPLLKKKGWDGLLVAMQTRIDQLTKN